MGILVCQVLLLAKDMIRGVYIYTQVGDTKSLVV